MSKSSKKKRKKTAWATSVKDYVDPCKDCPFYYRGEIRSDEGGIIQIITCEDICPKK